MTYTVIAISHSSEIPLVLIVDRSAPSAPMKLADLKATLSSIGRHLRLMSKAMVLNISVCYLELRLWLMKQELEGFTKAIGTARERMHIACKKDAQAAFERTLGNISINCLGLQPNIVQSLNWARIHSLKELGEMLWSLQSIPNIGPMREQLIKKAYARQLEKAAIESSHTLIIIEEIRNYIAFREAMHAIKDKLGARLEAIRAQADDYYADSGKYCDDASYRDIIWKEKERLWAETKAFVAVSGAELKKAYAGQATVVLMPIQDRSFQSMAAVELTQITFTLSYGFFNTYQVKSGRVVS